MANLNYLSTDKINANLELNQIFESATQKLIVTDLTDNCITLTVLKDIRRVPTIKKLKNPITGETIEKSVIDNTPVLSDNLRSYSRDTFVKLIRNKTFDLTTISGICKHFGLQHLEINKFLVKQPTKL